MAGTPPAVLRARRAPVPPLWDGTFTDVFPPDTAAALLPHQAAGIRFGAARSRVLISDEPGLGKTLQALGICMAVGAARVLVICPLALLDNWASEVRKWTPWEAAKLGASKKRRGEMDRAQVWLSTYGQVGLAKRAMLAEVLGRNWDVVIVDESHALGSHKSQRTRVLALNPTSLLQRAHRVILLTGTPQLARPRELYAQMMVLFPEAKLSYFDFTARYCAGFFNKKFGPNFWDDTGSSHAGELHAWMALKTLRRRRTEIRLPPKTRRVVRVFVVGPALEAYRADAAAYEAKLQRMNASQNPGEASRLMFEVQLAKTALWRSTGRLKTGPEVRRLVARRLRALPPGQKIMFFANHLLIQRFLLLALAREGAPTGHVHGGTPQAEREALVRRLADPADPVRAGVLSIKACGAGLNATPGVTRIVFVEITWEVGMHEQCEARAHRIGAKHAIEVEYVVVDGTVDDDTLRKHARKQAVTSLTLDGAVEERVFEAEVRDDPGDDWRDDGAVFAEGPVEMPDEEQAEEEEEEL
jgi:SNF2 family DNA or RNA helicase